MSNNQSTKFVFDEMEYRKYLQRESAIWDYNTDMRGSRQQGYDEGYGKGVNEGVEKGYNKGVKEGYNKGVNEGYNKGHDEGVNEGVEKNSREMVDRMLAAKLPLSQIARISKWPLEKIEAYAKERHHEQ